MRATKWGMTRLPESFRWPNGGPQDVWYRWNMADKEQKMPPLRTLKKPEWMWLDELPKSEEEMRGAKGKNAAKRRKGKKTFNDMKFLCGFIQRVAKEVGLDVNDRSIAN